MSCPFRFLNSHTYTIRQSEIKQITKNEETILFGIPAAIVLCCSI